MDKFGRFITKAGIGVMMNVLFLLCSIPVVTMGQAWSALLTSIRYQIRGDSWWDGFKFGFKTRFLRGMLAWTVMLLVDAFALYNIMLFTANEQLLLPNLIASCVAFLVMAMVTVGVVVLNVYVPTPVGKWISNAAAMVFKAPLQMLGAAALMWFPIVFTIFFPEFFGHTFMIYLSVYFTLAGLGVTILLKQALMHFLGEARQEGVLLAEEGKQKDEQEEPEEEESK